MTSAASTKTWHVWTRYRFSLAQQLASEKVRLSNIVYLKASAYMTVKPFSDMFGATSRQVLSGELTLDELAALPTAELAQQLQAYGRQRFAAPEQRAAMLKQVAAESFGLPDEMVEAVDTVLDVGLAHIGDLEERIASLDQPIATAARQLPGYETLRTIPGIGPVYAAGLVAKIGEVGRFLEGSKRDHRERPRRKRRRDAEAGLAKLAGLYWPRKESGEFKGEDRHMSKRGNVYLRSYPKEGQRSHCRSAAQLDRRGDPWQTAGIQTGRQPPGGQPIPDAKTSSRVCHLATVEVLLTRTVCVRWEGSHAAVWEPSPPVATALIGNEAVARREPGIPRRCRPPHNNRRNGRWAEW